MGDQGLAPPAKTIPIPPPTEATWSLPDSNCSAPLRPHPMCSGQRPPPDHSNPAASLASGQQGGTSPAPPHPPLEVLPSTPSPPCTQRSTLSGQQSVLSACPAPQLVARVSRPWKQGAPTRLDVSLPLLPPHTELSPPRYRSPHPCSLHQQPVLVPCPQKQGSAPTRAPRSHHPRPLPPTGSPPPSRPRFKMAARPSQFPTPGAGGPLAT